jgi:hypothetical protein
MVRFDCTLFNTFLYICNFCGIKLCCDHIFTSRSSFHQNQKDNLCSDYTVYFHFHFSFSFFYFLFFFFFFFSVNFQSSSWIFFYLWLFFHQSNWLSMYGSQYQKIKDTIIYWLHLILQWYIETEQKCE